jgi:hypothetical protein
MRRTPQLLIFGTEILNGISGGFKLLISSGFNWYTLIVSFCSVATQTPLTTPGRTTPKRGRKPFFDPEIFQERFYTIERVFAWEDKFKRLLLRFERISQLHYTLKSWRTR